MVVLLLTFWEICMPLSYHFVLLWLVLERTAHLSLLFLFTPIFLLQQTKLLPSSSSALCSFFWFPGYNLTLDALKNPHWVKIPRDLLLPRCTCSLLGSLESLSLLFGTIDRHAVLAWVFPLTELPSADVSSLRTLQNTFFSPWKSRNHRKCMCVTGSEVSCFGNIKRTLGSSSNVQDTVYSYRDKWMWWAERKGQWHHCF